MLTRRFLFLALLLPCAPALAGDSPCVDTSKLEVGEVYNAAEEILLANDIGGEASSGDSSNNLFTVAEIVGHDGIPWYQVQNGNGRWGWVDSKLLAGRMVEPVQHDASDSCAPEKQVLVLHKLDDVARDYAALGESPSVEKLIALDGRVRKLVLEGSCHSLTAPPAGATATALGVYIGEYEGYPTSIEYHGKLLSDAYRVDPSSPLRPITLYSTVEYHDGSGDGRESDHRAAKAYLQEFPEGPHAADCAEALAWAYASAWASLEEPVVDDCMPHDLDDLKGESTQELRDYAGKTADRWFQELLRLRPPTPQQRSRYESWRDGKDDFRNCGGC